MSDKQSASFERRMQTALQESAERLDGATRSRLTQARHAALEAAKKPRSGLSTWLLPATGVAAAAALAMVLVASPPRQSPEQAAFEPVDEFEILAAEDSLEFYRDVEFYAWVGAVLDAEAAPEGGV
jgi:hypothetical protein